MDISPEDLRLQIAVMADGHFAGRSNRVAIRLKRERKIERLRSLLHDSGRAYKEAVVTKGTAIGFHVFNFEAPIKTKTFGPEFWAMSMEQLTLTALEVTYWDGSATERKKLTTFSFTSVDKASADFVQYVWIATGRSATVSQDKRTEKYRNGTCYTVTRSTTERGGPRGLKTLKGSDGSVSKVPTPDGFMYCFTVPTGMLVLRRGGRTFVTGNCGKTYGTVMHACYLMTIRSARQWIVLVPPIVLRNWSRFLAQVIDKSTGQPVTQTLYAGTPKQRAALSLDSQFILMSYDIFKRDYDKLTKHFDGRRVGLIADEAHKIKNMQSANYKSVWAMFNTQPVLLATGTPITTPDDAYTYMKFTNPLAYRNKRHFEQMHVGERDDYEKVTSWANLDKLKENFLVNWTIPEIVRDNSAPTNFIPIVYDLDSAHLRLYNELVEHQLLEMDDGRVIDALSTSALYHRCQQIICNWGHFEGDTDKTGAGFQLVEEVLDEIGDEKLVVVANYRMTTTGLAQHFKALAPALLIGGMSDAQRYKEIDRFTQDKACRIIIIQPEAGGVGLDGLQAVCNEMIFLECPTIPRQFEQAYARLDREGQVRQVNCRIAVANKTIQIKLHRSLLAKDDTIVKVTGGLKTLREAIHGT